MALIEKLKEWLIYTCILLAAAGCIFATLFLIQLILMVFVPLMFAAAIIIPIVLVSKKESILQALKTKLQKKEEIKQ